MQNKRLNKYIFISAFAATALSICCNLNIMIGPNSIDFLNLILSTITYVIWIILIISVIKETNQNIKKKIYITVILIAIILANALVFIWEDLGLQRPSLVEGLIPFVWISIAPFVGITGYLEQIEMPIVLKSILPYMMMLIIDITSLVHQTCIKK